MARYADIDDLIINKSHCDRDGKRFVYCDDIEPTADAREVVHARWIRIGRGFASDTYVCSSCKRESKDYGNFCPNCGAIMDQP